MTPVSDESATPVPPYCAIHQHHKWCEHNGGVMGPTGYEARDGSGSVPGWAGHTITLEFEAGYGPTLKLHCPPGVTCSTGSTCGGCGRDVDAPDDDGERCYDCPEPGSPRECWVKSWTDNLGADEVLAGTLVLPVTTSFDGDSLTLHIAGPPA